MYAADLHVHSKYSRATSRDCDAPHLDLWARRKGLGLVGTGDFTHPVWREELEEMLEEAGEGLYRLKDRYRLPGGPGEAPFFLVSGEISTIYKRDGRTRKVHHLILLPSLADAKRLSQRLEQTGNLHSDGRPILGLDSRDLLEILLETCPQAVYIPAHIWTPHFSVFGAFSGFDTLEECYGGLAGEVLALETGLSSDPPMNRLLSALDGRQLVSNSDAHSPAKLAREATLLEGPPSYCALRRAIRTGQGLAGTLEFFPQEGKYHLDGHRACGLCLKPWETQRLEGKCPVCGRRLTVGVLSRVMALADRVNPIPGKPFESLMPLEEVLADCLGVSPQSKKVQAAYLSLLDRLGSELFILRQAPLDQVERAAGPAVAEALRRLRAGQVRAQPGFDGQYGVLSLLEKGEAQRLSGQTALFALSAPAPRRLSALAEALEPPQGGARNEAPEDRGAAGKTAARRHPAAGEAVQSKVAPVLNPVQAEAVRAMDSVVAVIAGPGTGKTGALVERIVRLIQEEGALPAQITAITFTRQAAAEMAQRLTARLGRAGTKGLTVGTFHGVCLSLIPEKPLVGGPQATAVMARALDALGRGGEDPAKAQRLVSALKNGALPQDQEAEALRRAYDRELAALGARDLDDVLLEGLEAGLSGRTGFTYLLVDEFQDINPVQHRLVEHFAQAGRSLFVIGDPDQSIYGFRGADADCFRQLTARHPQARTLVLEENYRSSPQVLACALSLINHNPGPARLLRPNRPEGPRVRLLQGEDGFSEAVWIAGEIGRMVGGVGMLEARGEREEQGQLYAFSDIGVLCRTHRQLEGIESCLAREGIPCMVMGGEDFLADPAVRGLLGFFRALLDPRDRVSLGDALAGLWRCPELVQEAGEALFTLSKGQAAAVTPVLTPWLAAAQALWPRLNRDKPEKLLSLLVKASGAAGPGVDKLLGAAGFYPRMAAMLQELLLGGEADVRRLSKGAAAGGAVRLMTLHAAKGLEFPVVFLAGLNEGIMPLKAGDPQEERRLLFVGVTRAKEELILTCGGPPSPFLEELGSDIGRAALPICRRTPQVQQLRFSF